MSGHTEQWRWEEPVDLVNGGRSRLLVAANGRSVLRHEAWNWMVSDEDAALIAAAPAMHEALRGLTGWLRATAIAHPVREGNGISVHNPRACPICVAVAALAAADGPGREG